MSRLKDPARLGSIPRVRSPARLHRKYMSNIVRDRTRATTCDTLTGSRKPLMWIKLICGELPLRERVPPFTTNGLQACT